MKIILFESRGSGVVVPVHQTESGGTTFKVLLNAKLVPDNTEGKTKEAAENYCKKLCAIIGKYETEKENTWQVCAHFKWEPRLHGTPNMRLHGQLLEKLNGYCGENINLRFQRSLCRHKKGVRTCQMTFATGQMRVKSYSTCDEAFDERGCWEFNHAVEAYCDEKFCRIYDDLRNFCRAECGHSQFVTVRTRNIWFNVTDGYINTPDTGETLSDTEQYKRNVMKTIMRQNVSSDISIVLDDTSKMRAHKCCLIAHSPVFADMLQKYTFGRMRLRDISEECVNALLEFVYTFEISQASKCSKIAVELFVAANKYEMYKLEEKVAKMLLKRRNGWFNITATVELFLFVRKLRTTCTIDELKSKIGQVLKSKGKVRIMKSEGYQKLVADNVYAAAELCAAIAIAN